MIDTVIKSTLQFFNNTIHKVQKSPEYKDIVYEPVIDKIVKFSMPEYVTTLEHARLCVIVLAKDFKLVPRSLILHARCRCISQGHSVFFKQIQDGVECHDRINKYNPFSFHFVNYNLATKDIKRYYVETIENINKKHRLDYMSRKLLLHICKMVCQDEVLLKRLSVKFSKRFYEHRYFSFLLDLSYFFSMKKKCGICYGKVFYEDFKR